MFSKSGFFRAVAVPVCIVWGLVEMVALQRARYQHLRRKPIHQATTKALPH